jgi:alpha-glucosidase
VRRAFDDILRFWWDRGVAGFRIDVCHGIIKDAELRDNPPSTDDDSFVERIFGQRWVYNANRPEVHDVLRRWRRLADGYDPPCLLVGETNVDDLVDLASYYGDGTDELHLGFNFPFIEAPLEAGALRAIVERMEELLPPGSWPVWTGSNHDVSRLATRWAGGDARKVRAALLMLMTLRGTAVLYQGDEIGLEDGPIGREDLRDPVGVRFFPAHVGRDPERTPMPWDGAPGGGFTAPGVQPWLPMAEPGAANVADQRSDPHSVLQFARDVIALRRRTPDLAAGDYRSLPAPDGVWAWRRGTATTVALNLSDTEAALECGGTVVLATGTGPNGPGDAGPLRLAPWEGVVLSDG